jgi:TolB-like protein/Flp pilus assembly protein TadD/tRNA A-37 threonylcarbamoyl transferase component Bud32
MTDHFQDQVQRALGSAYVIERELGGGGMSRVFLALETALNRRVVVKVLPAEMAASVSIERFKREIALAARLQNPHIVPLLSAGDIDGLPYFTMPFVEGESLRARLTRGGELPVPEGLRLLREVASALDYAHEKGVVHRDIKPDNVLLSRGSAMVSDFGVAKALSASSNAENSGMTSLGVALGTPAYMSPEQAAANPNIDARADVYAFGIMAYELFAGRPPFAGRSPQAMLAAHVTEAPELIQKLRPALPPALAALIMRCLEKHPADRPQSAAEIVHSLDAVHTPSGGMQPTGTQPGTHAGYAAALPSASASPRPRARTALLAGGFAAAIIAVALVAATINRRASPGPDSTRTAARTAKSIAVVPFTGGDQRDEYFGDGVADELTSLLARVPNLGVAARSSAFAFKGKPLSSRQIGESLHVSTVVEGTVRRAESRLRMTVSLVNVADGLTLWSESYDRDARDVFAVQQDIAQKIAEQLKVTLGAGNSGTKNLAAHDLFLQGRFHAAKLVEPEQRRALELYEQAIALDSTYAAAWAGLADAWLILADDWAPATEAYPKAMAAARHALALDPKNAEAHALLGAAVAIYDWDYPAGLRETSRAVELAPSSTRALWYHGNLLIGYPRFNDSALAVFRKIEQLDPHDATGAAFTCGRLRDLKRYAEADAACQRALALDPGSPDAVVAAATLYRVEKRYADALNVLANPEVNVGRILSTRTLVYIAMGRLDNARKTVDEMLRLAKTRYIRTDGLPGIYRRLGDRERTIEMLERDWKDHAIDVRIFPFDDPLVKDDPRVQAIAKQVAAKRKDVL